MVINQNLINKWYDYYRSNVPQFHYGRYITENGRSVERNFKSLNIAKMLTKELSSYTLAEVEYPAELPLSYNKLLSLTEATFSLGQILIVYLPKTKDIKVFSALDYTYNEIDNVMDITIDNDNFRLDLKTNKYYQVKEGKGYLIDSKVEYRVFSLLDDIEYPNGKSIFADCLDILESVDMRYSFFYDEFVLGKPMVVVTEEALRVVATPPTEEQLIANPQAKPTFIQYLGEDDVVFKTVAGNPTSIDNQSPIKQIEFNLRTENFIQAINLDLSLISKHAGFDNSFMSFEPSSSSLKTATEVISKKSQLYKNTKMYQFKLKVLLEWFCEKLNIEYEDKITFGDSIIVSDEQLKQDGLNLIAINAIDKFTLLTKYYGYTSEKANEVLELLKKQEQEELDKEIALLNSTPLSEDDDMDNDNDDIKDI